MRSLMLSLSLFSLPLLGGFRAPERLGSLAVANTPNGFAVIKDGKVNPIESDCVDSMLRKMDFNQRNAYLLNGGCLEINQADTQEYTLKSVANLKGGGKVTGWIAYGLVMVPSIIIVAIINKMDKTNTAPTDKMLESAHSVAKVAQSFGNTLPTP